MKAKAYIVKYFETPKQFTILRKLITILRKQFTIFRGKDTRYEYLNWKGQSTKEIWTISNIWIKWSEILKYRSKMPWNDFFYKILNLEERISYL